MSEKTPEGEVSEKVRDASRAYYAHVVEAYRNLMRNRKSISQINSGKPVYKEEALRIIKDISGAESFKDFLEITKDMPRQPKPLIIPESSRSLKPLTQEDRDAVRTFHFYTELDAKKLGISVEISLIENGYHIPPAKALATIKRAWGFDSFDQLHTAVLDLPPAIKQLNEEIIGAVAAYRYHTDDNPETKLRGKIRNDVRLIENSPYGISPAKALKIIDEAWGIKSFTQMIEKAHGLPRPYTHTQRNWPGSRQSTIYDRW